MRARRWLSGLGRRLRWRSRCHGRRGRCCFRRCGGGLHFLRGRLRCLDGRSGRLRGGSRGCGGRRCRGRHSSRGRRRCGRFLTGSEPHPADFSACHRRTSRCWSRRRCSDPRCCDRSGCALRLLRTVLLLRGLRGRDRLRRSRLHCLRRRARGCSWRRPAQRGLPYLARRRVGGGGGRRHLRSRGSGLRRRGRSLRSRGLRRRLRSGDRRSGCLRRRGRLRGTWTAAVEFDEICRPLVRKLRQRAALDLRRPLRVGGSAQRGGCEVIDERFPLLPATLVRDLQQLCVRARRRVLFVPHRVALRCDELDQPIALRSGHLDVRRRPLRLQDLLLDLQLLLVTRPGLCGRELPARPLRLGVLVGARLQFGVMRLHARLGLLCRGHRLRRCPGLRRRGRGSGLGGHGLRPRGRHLRGRYGRCGRARRPRPRRRLRG